MAQETQKQPAESADLDPVAETILTLLSESEGRRPISPGDVAHAIFAARRKPGDAPDLWRRYLPAVKQQALFLARRGDIVILRKGKVADPQAPIKGLIRLSLPPASPS